TPRLYVPVGPGRDPSPGRSRTPMTVRIRALTEKTLCAPEERNAPLITTPVIGTRAAKARRGEPPVRRPASKAGEKRVRFLPPLPGTAGPAEDGRPGPVRTGLWCNGSTLPLQGRDQGSTPCGSTRPGDHGRGAPRTGRGAAPAARPAAQTPAGSAAVTDADRSARTSER